MPTQTQRDPHSAAPQEPACTPCPRQLRRGGTHNLDSCQGLTGPRMAPAHPWQHWPCPGTRTPTLPDDIYPPSIWGHLMKRRSQDMPHQSRLCGTTLGSGHPILAPPCSLLGPGLCPAVTHRPLPSPWAARSGQPSPARMAKCPPRPCSAPRAGGGMWGHSPPVLPRTSC